MFFDTCVYHQPGIDLLTKVVPVENILFASEMIGAVRGVDPETGHHYDDTKRYIEASAQLTPADKQQIYEGNARRVYPRLDAALDSEREVTMYEIGVVYRNIQRADAAIADELAAFGSATVHEAMGRVGLMKPVHAPDLRRRAGVGHGGDRAAAARRQLDAARRGRADPAGDVVVAAVTADCTDGFFGELLATSFKARGARALVIDGGCRDVKALTEMGFPVWSRAINAKGTVKATLGSVNIPVVCAGALVHPGDVIVADDDGVVCVPRAHRRRRRSTPPAKREANEADKRAKLAAGVLGLDMYKMREPLAAAGLRYID